ncbi:proton-conducting transporter transmembrane domain-containing protein [Acetomicrobium sp. S15 = DSM 107314]|uniref:proton-conducting transporter transmembrane domain-containing protein n=1 Tax=Acetomicrobium sp. S15 = DSM 107314 TaxID=2529858 RepID=UPI0018E1BB9A|nr:proton-conducting transporter membrane subunit [Acetomicrobium sp. S15 = DSM 107314]
MSAGLRLSFVFDPLSILMATLALFMTAAVSIYSLGYAKPENRRERKLFSIAPWLFCLFSCLSVFSSDWFFFALFLELSSVVLFFMILPVNFRTAVYYLLAQLSGSLLVLLGAAFMLRETGTAAMGPVPAKLLWLFIPGVGIKAALPGLHFWLPKVHSEAPTPASALLSGFAVKLGIYGLARLVSPPAAPALLFLGPAMALYGVFQALMQHDAKRLLAYHTVSQLGYIVSAIGAGTALGVAAGAYHAVAHALFKGLLFLTVGTLEKAYGTRDLRFLGSGAARTFPLTFALFLVGALAIAGFPGMSGFASKAMVKTSLKETSHYAILWMLQAASVGTVLSFCKLGYFGFFAKDRQPLQPCAKELPRAKKDKFRNAGMGLLAAGTVFLGLRPQVLPTFMQINCPAFFESDAILSAVVPIFIGGILFLVLRKVLAPADHKTHDVDSLLTKIYVVLACCPALVAKLHTGRLRFYIVTVIITALSAFFFIASY